MNCSIAKAPDQIGKWWSLLIVRECTQGVRRFDEFQARLGIARNILTTRLERLTGLGVLERFPLEGRARVDGYRLIPKGEDLSPVLVALMQWGDRWLLKDEQPPTVLLEDATGESIDLLAVHGKSGRRLSFRDVRSAEGPGATNTARALIKDRNERVLSGG